jgi:hypothetical protein
MEQTKHQKYGQYPHGLKAYTHTKATIFDLMVYNITKRNCVDSTPVSDDFVAGLAMEFERLNFRQKWKPDSEDHIVNFCEIKTRQYFTQ